MYRRISQVPRVNPNAPELYILQIKELPIVDEGALDQPRYTDIELLASWLNDGCGGTPAPLVKEKVFLLANSPCVVLKPG